MSTRLSRTATVPHTPRQMYELVNNIEQYPTFLPWCVGAHILQSSQDSLQASLHFAKGLWRQSFTTANQMVPDQEIRIQLLNGPFQYLEGIWHFKALNSHGTHINLELNFEFKNRLLGFTMGPLIQQLSTQVVKAFTDRALQIYG